MPLHTFTDDTLNDSCELPKLGYMRKMAINLYLPGLALPLLLLIFLSAAPSFLSPHPPTTLLHSVS